MLTEQRKLELREEFKTFHWGKFQDDGFGAVMVNKIADYWLSILSSEIDRAVLVSNIALMKLLVEGGKRGDLERLISEFTERLEKLLSLPSLNNHKKE